MLLINKMSTIYKVFCNECKENKLVYLTDFESQQNCDRLNRTDCLKHFIADNKDLVIERLVKSGMHQMLTDNMQQEISVYKDTIYQPRYVVITKAI